MLPPQLFCPGGAESQTGSAIQERYPETSISNCGKISDIRVLLENNEGPYVIPIWNSHEGEVKAANYVWDGIETETISILDLWAKRIHFWYVERMGEKTSHHKIGSVIVAKSQCSEFLALHSEAEFEKYDLTTDALAGYKAGDELDGVLIAPMGAEHLEGYEVLSTEAANGNNFTSFVQLVPTRSFNPDSTQVASWLTGVTMPALGYSMLESQRAFFDQLLDSVRDLRDLPKLIFVFRREAKVGLLIDGIELFATDLLDAEEIETGEIIIHERSGAIEKKYTEEIEGLFEREFSTLREDDFILHQGVNTCLFCCPPLGLYTHGYEQEAVEPVVRFYISKIFELWDSGLECSPRQNEFFEKYYETWEEQGSEFINFKIVS